MPKSIKLIRVFVASPGDVAQERETASRVVDELNKTLYLHTDYKFEFIGWETDTYPSVGKDAQDVINNEINDDYDVFVGIMWNRFGSKTGRANSGTEEEYLRAYTRHLKNPEEIKIMFYFKTTPVSNEDIDIEQLQKLRSFKKTIGEKGVYYWTFDESNEFSQLLRIHLTRIVKEFKDESNELPKTLPVKEDAPKSISDEPQEVGMFENLELATDLLDEVNEVITRISVYTTDLGSKFDETTEEIATYNKLPPNLQVAKAKLLSDKVALDIDNFTKRTEIEIPTLNEKFKYAMDAYRRAWSIYSDLNISAAEKEHVLNSLTALSSQIGAAHSGIGKFKYQLEKFPPLTTKLGRSRNAAVQTLKSLLKEFEKAIQLIDEILKI